LNAAATSDVGVKSATDNIEAVIKTPKLKHLQCFLTTCIQCCPCWKLWH